MSCTHSANPLTLKGRLALRLKRLCTRDEILQSCPTPAVIGSLIPHCDDTGCSRSPARAAFESGKSTRRRDQGPSFCKSNKRQGMEKEVLSHSSVVGYLQDRACASKRPPAGHQKIRLCANDNGTEKHTAKLFHASSRQSARFYGQRQAAAAAAAECLAIPSVLRFAHGRETKIWG